MDDIEEIYFSKWEAAELIEQIERQIFFIQCKSFAPFGRRRLAGAGRIVSKIMTCYFECDNYGESSVLMSSRDMDILRWLIGGLRGCRTKGPVRIVMIEDGHRR